MNTTKGFSRRWNIFLWEKCRLFGLKVAAVFACLVGATSFAGQISGTNETDIALVRGAAFSGIVVTGAPVGAVITSVECRIRVVAENVGYIQLNLVGPGADLNRIWADGLTGATDGGRDDDVEDDNDIYYNWRDVAGPFYVGMNPNSAWILEAYDTRGFIYPGWWQQAHIDYFEIRVNYQDPSPDLVAFSTLTTVDVGEQLPVTITAENDGRDTSEGAIHVAAKHTLGNNYLTVTAPTGVEWSNPPKLWAPGQGAGQIYNQGSCTPRAGAAQDWFVETYNTWDSGVRRSMSFKVTSQRTGIVKLLARTTMYAGPNCYDFLNDTSATTGYGEENDEQGWACRLYEVAVARPLADDTPANFNISPEIFSLAVKANDWGAVAIAPTTTDRNLRLGDDAHFNPASQISAETGTTRDFVVVDGNQLGNTTMFTEVYGGGSDWYAIEADAGAYDLDVGNGRDDQMASNEVLDLYEVGLTAGQKYEIKADVTSGNADISLFVFSPSQTSGTRAGANWRSTNPGAGGDEVVVFTATTSGQHAIVVINENSGTSNYRLSIEPYEPDIHITPSSLLITLTNFATSSQTAASTEIQTSPAAAEDSSATGDLHADAGGKKGQTVGISPTKRHRTSCIMNINPKPITHTQSNGRSVLLFQRGGYNRFWLEDADGYPVLQKEKGSYVYASLNANRQLIPTSLVVGQDDPKESGLHSRVLPASKRNSPQDDAPLPLAINPVGTRKNLVVLMKFADHAGRTLPSRSNFDVIFNQTGGDPTLAPSGSIRDYYLQTSYGIFTLNSTVVTWVTLSHNEAYYAGGMSGIGTPRFVEAINEALSLVDPSVNFSLFDTDADNVADLVTFIHSGYAAEWDTATDPDNQIWSHANDMMPWTSQEGVTVNFYTVSAGLWGTSGSSAGHIGVICHEIGHALGLPDLYDTDDTSHGVGSWCLMANSWGFGGEQLDPPHYSAWCKAELGWLTPTVLNSPGTHNIPKAEASPTVFRVDQGYAPGEYLLIENRQASGFEPNIPQGGLAIWHVDESKRDVTDNDDEGYPGQPAWPSNSRHYLVALLQADGRYDLEREANQGDSTDLYRAGLASEINSVTVPNTDGYQNGAVVPTGNRIYNISSSGSTMGFSFAPSDGGIRFAVRNLGRADLHVAPISLETTAPWLTWDQTAPFTVPTNGSKVITVNINTNAAPIGVSTNRFIVQSDDPDENPYPGGVFINVTNISQPVIAVGPASHDFGSVQVGGSVDRTFTVTNTGAGTLSGSASTAPPFSVFSGDSYILNQGQSQPVVIRYGPTVGGSNFANVTFTGGGGASRSVSGLAYDPPRTIFGYVRLPNSTGVAGVTLTGLPGNPVTDANGYYTGTATNGWTGTVTPAKIGYEFSPSARSYANLSADQTAQNYTATATFVNLDFESANIPLGYSLPIIDVTSAIPGWRVFAGTGSPFPTNNETIFINYNSDGMDSASAVLTDGAGFPPIPVIEGSYSLGLFAEGLGVNYPAAYMAQQGFVPALAKSMRIRARNHRGSSAPKLALAGAELVVLKLNGAGIASDVYAANCSSYAGSNVELRVSTSIQGYSATLVIDSIEFRNEAVWNLDVVSAFGSVTPSGRTMYADGAFVTCNAPGLPITNGNSRFDCVGWTGTGSAPSSGTSTIIPPFMVNTNSSVTWLWQTNYWLDTAVAGGGSVDVGDGWQAAKSSVTITAMPSAGYVFAGWTGDVPVGQQTLNPLSISMTQARSVTAQFVVRPPPEVVVWGDNSAGQRTVPVGVSNVVALSVGRNHCLALKNDGSVVGWGANNYGQISIPGDATNIIAIAAGGGVAGYNHSLALRADGKVIAWGATNEGLANVPQSATNVISVSAGGYHNLALKGDGTVIAWGDNSGGQTNVPSSATNIVAISAGQLGNLAVRADGTVLAWGYMNSAPANATNVIAVAAGDWHSLVVRSDGVVVAWGDNYNGESSVPASVSNAVAVAAGEMHSLALLANGVVVAWGYGGNGQTTVPVNVSNVLAIAACGANSGALVDVVAVPSKLWRPTRIGSTFSVTVPTVNRKSYLLEFKDSLGGSSWTPLQPVSGNGGIRILSDPSSTAQERYYRVRTQ